MSQMLMLARNLVLVFAAVAPFLSRAWTWEKEPTEALRARLVGYAEESGHGALAKRIAAERNLTDWIGETVEYAERGLATCEGADRNDTRRQSLLRLVDYPVHVDSYSTNTPAEIRRAWREAMTAQNERARRRVFAAARATRVREGELGVFHFYNMGYLLKGPRHAIALDVTDTPCAWTDAEREELSELADFFVLTHPHRDHYSRRMLAPFLARGKPVVLPCDVGVTNALARILSDNHDSPVDVAGVGIRNFMGNQGVPCNVYQFDIDGIRVVSPGDNDDASVYANLARGAATDVIIAPSWNFPSNIVLGCASNPKFDRDSALFLPSHFNELGHGVRNRESYWEAYWRDDRLTAPNVPWPRTVILYLGESLLYRRSLKGDGRWVKNNGNKGGYF